MNGLEQILEEITADSAAFAEKTLDQANAQVVQILRRAEMKASEIEHAANEQAEQITKARLAHAESAGKIRAKRVLLHERQQLVTETIRLVEEHLAAMDDASYFSLLLRLLKKYASGAPGTLFLSERDLAHVTPEFLQNAENMGLSVAEATRPITGGFLLSYGDVEENCSFEALLETEKDRLQDVICRVLFQEEVAQ